MTAALQGAIEAQYVTRSTAKHSSPMPREIVARLARADDSIEGDQVTIHAVGQPATNPETGPMTEIVPVQGQRHFS
eukprot:CAMPEP_0171059666 /NCGR_PEP_ID=MMETSP0766_2-20121228/3329_1 /TAXON_ID=439317 /ORGANISM="Gambierdiscus australes, Strain CAWD 149" /LENGTH=75 /DNA_ID=CAMNT_0011515139 /DNA_START=265 /DNA_END=493 /DNA_ORIENTATION=-